MITLITIAIFFSLLILVYPMVCALLTLWAWYRMRHARGTPDELEKADLIEAQTDRLKSKAFLITILLTFFGVAPFAAIWLMTR